MVTTSVWLWGLVSVIAVSLVSLAAVFTLAVGTRKLKQVTFILVSLAVGTLLGDAFIHIIPKAVENIGGKPASIYVLVGIFVFFVLEKVLRWQHDHHIDHVGHDHTIGYINLVSDGLHNLIDGVLIGVSYIVAIPVGIATTIAVFLHEVPQEMSDFGILIHAGFSRARALLFNFLSALVAVAGLVIALLLGKNVDSFVDIALPLTAGGFIYIAVADLIPELQERSRGWQVSVQIIMIAIGITLMALLTFLE